MKMLLDSHILIWHREDDARLPLEFSQALEDPANELFVSVATLWELTIKESLGKLNIVGGVEKLQQDWVGSGAATLLNIHWLHLERLQTLPMLHGDPFDRILVAQSLTMNSVLLSQDPKVRQYPDLKLL